MSKKSSPASGPPQPRLRLLRLVVQPTFVYDDGETLTEWTGPAALVPAGEWQKFAKNSFSEADLEKLREQYEQSTNSTPTLDVPPARF